MTSPDPVALAEADVFRLLPPDAGPVDRIKLALHLETLYRRVQAAEAEVSRLRHLIDGLTARVAAQSELLTERAERYP